MLELRGRGDVMMSVASMDAALERLWQAVLLARQGSTDTCFQPDRPLGSFGQPTFLINSSHADRIA